MTSKENHIYRPLHAARSVSQTEKSTANMAMNTMATYEGDGTTRKAPIVADRYNARIVRDTKKNIVKETPEQWVTEVLDPKKRSESEDHLSKIDLHSEEAMIGVRLFPEYSLPIRFLDAKWSQHLTLGALKTLHLVFATYTQQPGPVTIKKRAIGSYLAKSKNSLCTSLVKESNARLKDLSVTIGIHRPLNIKIRELHIDKVFDKITDNGDSVTFVVSELVAQEFRSPRLYVPLGLNTIQKFGSLHSLLLFSAMMGHNAVSFFKHSSRLKKAKARNRDKKLQNLVSGYEGGSYEHVPDWTPGSVAIKLHHLADLIGLPDGDDHRQRKRIQKRVIDAAEKIKATFGDDFIGPQVKIDPEYGSETVKQRKNLTTETGEMKLSIRPPWRPAQYAMDDKQIRDAFKLDTSTDLFIGSIEFQNTLAIAGFNGSDPSLAAVIHTDWKVFLWRNRDRVEKSESVVDLYHEYHSQLVPTGRFDPLDEPRIGHKVGQWWNALNGTFAEFDDDVVLVDYDDAPEPSEKPTPEEEIVLPEVQKPDEWEAIQIEDYSLRRNPFDHDKIHGRLNGRSETFNDSNLEVLRVRKEVIPFKSIADARQEVINHRRALRGH